MSRIPPNAGIIGMGGFAAAHHDAILSLEKQGLIRLICSCDPNLDLFAERMKQLDFDGRGVRVFDNYLKMLDECGHHLDLVIVPTPIPLHAEMHRECVRRNLPVYLEKPPTLSYQELEEMIETERNAKYKTIVGFSWIAQKFHHNLKKRIISGDFGTVRKVTFLGNWPRHPDYYTRTPWAGRLFLDNRMVLDSCFGNAMAHYIHNLLFWCGSSGIFSWGNVTSVEAELYRCHAIESADTVFARALTESGIEVLVAETHACAEKTPDIEKIICDRAAITFYPSTGSPPDVRMAYEVTWNDGRKEYESVRYGNLLEDNLLAYVAYLKGDTDRPETTLEDCRPFVLMNGLLFISSGNITRIPENFLEHVEVPLPGKKFIAIKNIRSICEEFLSSGKFPKQQGINWGSGHIPADASEIRELEKVVKKIGVSS